MGMHSTVLRAGEVRCLGFVDLVSFGIGNCVGAGLFVTIGPAAVNFAGPAVTLSFLLGGFAAMLTALSPAAEALAMVRNFQALLM